MEFKFSERIKKVKTSKVDALLPYRNLPDMISFSDGAPSPHSFPVSELNSIIHDIMDNHSYSPLQYGTSEGLYDLRVEIQKYIEKRENIIEIPDNIMITTGSQQALYEIPAILANPGDYCIIEAPTYFGLIDSISANNINSVSVEMDDDGMKTDMLEQKIKELKLKGIKPRFIYTIPTFQNPSGYTMSLDRRKHLLEIAYKYNIPVMEDNPYGDLRYSGEHMPTLKSLDKNNIVTYLGTFSKIMAPGLRLGYIVSQPEILEKFVDLKQAIDIASDSLSQYIGYKYLKDGIIYKQIEKTINIYRQKRDIMLNSLENNINKADARWSKPDGGMFLWMIVNGDINTVDMLKIAIDKHLIYVPGDNFFHDKPVFNTMRLNFTYPNDDEIKEGVFRLSNVLKTAKNVA